MKRERTSDDDFCFAVELGLMKAGVPAKRSRGETRDERDRRRKQIARQVVDQIRLANWRIERCLAAGDPSTAGEK